MVFWKANVEGIFHTATPVRTHIILEISQAGPEAIALCSSKRGFNYDMLLNVVLRGTYSCSIKGQLANMGHL